MARTLAAAAVVVAGATATGTREVRTNRRDLDEMAQVVHAAFFDATRGMYWRLDPADQVKLGYTGEDGRWHWGTVIDVVGAPSREEMSAAGVHVDPESGTRDRLLGLFTADVDAQGELIEDPRDPPRIQLFAGEILAAGYDPVDVAFHEFGHRLRYNDEHHDPGPTASTASLPAATADWAEPDCPLCAVDGRLSLSERALAGLRERAHMQHRIPVGLGGRIPEVRNHLARAALRLQEAATIPQVGRRAGEVRQLSDLIEAAQSALEGDHLTPQDISVAHALTHRAWDAGVDLGHAYFASLHAD